MHTFRPRHDEGTHVYEVGWINGSIFTALFKVEGLVNAIDAVGRLNGSNASFEFYRLNDEIKGANRIKVR